MSDLAGKRSNSEQCVNVNSLLTAKLVRLATPHPSRNPAPITKANALAYLMFDRPNLARAEKFLKDFGLRVVSRDANRLFLKANDDSPYCYVINRAKKAKFVGLGFRVKSTKDLENLAKVDGASAIEDVTWPGGGQRVRLVDPAGFAVHAVCGQTPVEPVPHRAPINLNSPDKSVRVNKTQRPPVSPPEITKLGHVLIEVPNYQDSSAWYTKNFGLIPSDIMVLPDGSPAATFFRLDLGETPADHHTLAMVQSFMASYNHSAFEVVDPDAVGMGQRVLRAAGWTHSWGIGRHILGSQIFDYWQDPWGSKHEHYCDGDIFTSELSTDLHVVSREAMAQWGPSIPKSFTKPDLSIGSIIMLIKNLFTYKDLTVGKLYTLIKLVS